LLASDEANHGGDVAVLIELSRVAVAIALLSLCLSSVTFASYPVGIVAIPHDAKLPSRSYVAFPIVGYRGDEPTSELLVWRKSGTASKPKYVVRNASGVLSWIEPEKSEYTDLEETLEDAPGLILEIGKWDGKLRSTPDGTSFTTLSALPPELQFDSELVMPVPSCHVVGSVTDRSGAEWTQETCEKGRSLDLFDDPEGGRVQFPNRAGILEDFTPAETEVGTVFVSYVKPSPFGQRMQSSVLVYEQRDGWVKAHLRSIPPYHGRWVWIKLSSTEASVEKMTEASKDAAVSQIAELRQLTEDPRTEFWVKAHGFSTASGQRWAWVDVYAEDPCSFPESPKVMASGWVPLMATPTSLQFSVTTCD
jgi:hypothetical protein